MSAHRFHGLEIPVRAVGGGRAIRVAHPPGQRIAGHRHDWPLLTIPALGGYREECEDGVHAIDGPAAILHPAGRCHANCIHDRGMETFSIEFDPDWLGPKMGRGALAIHGSHFCIGGSMALAARALARLWDDASASEERLRRSTARFVEGMLRHRDPPRPKWLELASRLASAQVGTGEIAERLRLHPAWLARAYRAAAGEGLRETARRRRVEQAIALLRRTDDSIAQIATAAGFCDQSHLNRAVRDFTGRTPLRIRAEREPLRALMAA